MPRRCATRTSAFPLLLILALLGSGAWWAAQNRPAPWHPAGSTVRIATWNLRQFSDRPNIDLRTIADVIVSNHFDIVAIQEVKKRGQEVDRLLNVLGPPWRATRFSDLTGNFERFVFIYNGDHVQEIGSAHFIASADAIVFDRTPFQASFRAGNFDFVLITVHLSYSNVERRRKEAQALAHFVSQVPNWQEKDYIILGDFNEQKAGNLHYFDEIGWKSLNHNSTNLGGTQTYDTLLIDPKYTKEWNGTSGAVDFDETIFHNDDKRALDTVSDHRPAYADFVTSDPDDD
jgi:hypothetical protein